MVVSRHVACFVVGVLPIHGKKTCLGAQLNSARCENVKHFPTQDIGAENENDGKNI